MNLSATEKKFLAIGMVALVLFAGIVVGAATLLANTGKTDERPHVQIAVGDTLTKVDPLIWCDVLMRECDPPYNSRATRSTAKAPVTVGQSAVVSVPAEIATGPWSLVAEYYTPHGYVRDERILPSNSQYTVVLHSTLERTLVTIQIQAPSAVETPDGFIVRGTFSVDTTPTKRT